MFIMADETPKSPSTTKRKCETSPKAVSSSPSNSGTDVQIASGAEKCALPVPDQLTPKPKENQNSDKVTKSSLSTKMEFWFDSTAGAQLQAEAYRATIEDSKILTQLVYQVHDYLFDVRKVAKYNPGVYYNTPVQIFSEIIRENPEFLILSTLITERQMIENNLSTLREGCMVTMAHETRRLRRNVFVLVPVNRSEQVSPVMFGDHFFIRLVDDPVYVLGDVPNLNNIGGYGDKIPVILTDIPSRFCKFQIFDPIDEANLEVLGTEVPTFESLVINHVVSNQNLEVILDRQIITMFSRDFAVACHSSPTSILRTTRSNYWQIHTMNEEETRTEMNESK